MKPFRTITSTALIVLIAAVFTVPSAHADHNRTLVTAARNFKDACKDLEIAVMRTRYLARDHVRLVNDYEARSIGVHGAAHNTRDLDRLLRKWNEVCALHPRVQRTLFDPSCYPYNATLTRCWDAVDRAFCGLRYEINCLTGPNVPDVRRNDAFQLRPPIAQPRSLGHYDRLGRPSGQSAPYFDQRYDNRLSAPQGINPRYLRDPLSTPFRSDIGARGTWDARDTWNGRAPGRVLAVPPLTPTNPFIPQRTAPRLPQAVPGATPPIPYEVSIPARTQEDVLTRRLMETRAGRIIAIGAMLSRM